MRVIASSISLMAATAFSPAHAIDMWHSHSSPLPQQGYCVATFSFDSAGGKEVTALEVGVSVLDKSGKKLSSDVLKIDKVGETPVDREASAFLESKALCGDDGTLSITVTSATGQLDGKRVDLLKGKLLSVRKFKPLNIQIKKD